MVEPLLVSDDLESYWLTHLMVKTLREREGGRGKVHYNQALCSNGTSYLDNLAKGSFPNDLLYLIAVGDVIVQDLDVAAVLIIITYAEEKIIKI